MRLFSLMLLSVVFVIASSCYIIINPTIAPGPWATVCEVRTTDSGGNPKVEFASGETVYIHWNADGMINMTVYAPDGATIDHEWAFLPASGINSFVPSYGNGLYEINCNGACTKIVAIGTVLVVPELPVLGTLMGVVTMFGAFFLLKRRRTR